MSKLTGNQEFNGDVYVKGVGGYDGITPEGTLQEFLSCESLTEAEWREIFKVEDVEEGLFILYIDDFPDDKVDEIIDTYGAVSLDGVVEMIANDPLNTRGETEHGVNFGVPTCETLEYEGEIYRVYIFTTRLYGNYGDNHFALLPTSITYTELFRMSMQYNSENRRCPFVMILMDGTTEYEPTVGLDEAFSLVCVKQIAPWKKPKDTSHGEEITYMYMDNFTCNGASLVQVIKERGETFDDYLTFIKENPELEGAGNRFAKNGTITYEGVTYDLWLKTDDDSNVGGLAPQNLTYSQLYPHTLECDSANAFEPYSPFVTLYFYGVDDDRYNPATKKFSNLIAIE